MKPYNGAKRTMLQVCAKSASVFGALSAQTLDALGGDLKTKQHKLAVSFNKPEDPATKLELALHFPGSRYLQAKEELAGRYAGTFPLDGLLEAEGIGAEAVDSEVVQLTAEVAVTLKDAEAAEQAAAKLTDVLERVQKLGNRMLP